MKEELESHLRRLMPCTERLSAGNESNGMLRSATAADVMIEPSDLRAYAGLKALTDALEVEDAIEY